MQFMKCAIGQFNLFWKKLEGNIFEKGKRMETGKNHYVACLPFFLIINI